jgi:hypothetical protein
MVYGFRDHFEAENRSAIQEVVMVMDKSEREAGSITALMVRFVEYRLPRAKELLAKVQAGERLSDGDILFLNKVYKDSLINQSLFRKHHEYHGLISRFIDLYAEIVSKGMENEKTD